MKISLEINDGKITPDEFRVLRTIVDAFATRTCEDVRQELSDVRNILHEDRPDVGASIDLERHAREWAKAAKEMTGFDTSNLRQLDDGSIEAQPSAAAIFGGQGARGEQFNQEAATASSANPLVIPVVPLPPTVAAAPSDAPVSEGAPNPQPPAVDTRGLPWDARIHASTKAINADGTWRAKRGINDPDLVPRVEAQLRAIMAAPVPAPVAPPPPASYISPEAAEVGLNVLLSAHPVDFAGLMQKATQLMAAQKLTREELEQCAQVVGLPSIIGAVSRADLIPSISGHIDTLVASKG